MVENATSATITPGVGTVDPRTGSVVGTPTADHHLHLDRDRPERHDHLDRTVTVGAARTGNPQIIRFEANPVTISSGPAVHAELDHHRRFDR